MDLPDHLLSHPDHWISRSARHDQQRQPQDSRDYCSCVHCPRPVAPVVGNSRDPHQSVWPLLPACVASANSIIYSYYSILDSTARTKFSFLVRALQIPATVGLILCIVGATNAKNPADIESESTVHIGIILFAVVFAALVLLTGFAIHQWRFTGRGESRMIMSVAITLPFLAVRVLYSLLAAFSHDSKFNPVSGSTTIALVMETLQEAVVVLIYLAAGLMAPKVAGELNGNTGRRDRSWHGRGTSSQQGYPLTQQQMYGQSEV